MKLSIITINYNNKEGLEKTILSVIKQENFVYQYIVIDGNSSDGSKDILDKYKKNIDVLVSEPDSGIYNAMNKGAKSAEGEYLLFLNSGDTLYSNDVLESLFKTNPDEDIVSCNLYVYSDKYAGLQMPPQNISLYTFTGGSLPHPSTIIKNSIFKKVGGYKENYRIISDWCFFVDALIINNCSYKTIPIILSSFNCFGISSTSLNKETKLQEEYLYLKFPRVMSDYQSVKDEAINNVTFWICNLSGIWKTLLSIPFKIINNILNLRNKLGKRIGVLKVK